MLRTSNRPSSRTSVTRALAVLAALLASAAGLVGAAPPAQAAPVRYVDEVFTTVDQTSNIIYGRAMGQNGPEALKLDMYQPQGDTALLRPAVIYVHGGFFAPGYDKTGPDAVVSAQMLARRGYVVVSIDYRVYAGPALDLTRLAIAMRAALDDTQAAIRWLRANAATYRLHTDAIAVGGYSAGAFTALNVANLQDSVGYSGSPGYRQDIAAAFAFAGWATQIQPNAAPVVQFAGEADTLVPFVSQRAGCDAAVAAGNICEFHGYPGADHVSLGVLYLVSDMIPKVVTFLGTYLVPKLALPPSSPLAVPTGPVEQYALPATGAAVTNRDGRLEVFGPVASGQIQNVFQYAIGLGWSPFYPVSDGVGASIAAPVSASRNADGRLEVAVLGADGKVRHSGQRPDGLGWLPFDNIGNSAATITSPPSLARNADGRLEVFAISSGGRLVHAFQDRLNGTWSDWYELSSVAMNPTTAPGVGTWSAGELAVVALGADAKLYTIRQAVGGPPWTPMVTLEALGLGGTGAIGRPAVAFDVPYHVRVPSPPGMSTGGLTVAYRGLDGFLHVAQTTGVLTGTSVVVDSTTAVNQDPTIGVNADGRAEVFVGATGGELWHSFADGSGRSFSSLYKLGGSCAHAPAVVANDDLRLEVFCLAADGQVRHDFQKWANGPWYGSTSLGGSLVA